MLGTSDPYGRSTQFHRDLRGQLLARTDAEGRSVQLQYDQAHRLQSLVNENGEAFRFSYDASDRLVQEQRVGGTCVELAYNANGWPIRVIYHPRTDGIDDNALPPAQPRRIELIRDAAGRLLEKRTQHQHYHYRYDDADQLLEASVHAVHYLDAQDMQELQQAQPDQVVQPWRLKRLHTTTFTYDQRGRLTQETVCDHLSGDVQTLAHQHDALGNRLQTTLPALPAAHPQAGSQRALHYLFYGSGHLHQINYSLQPSQDALAVHQLICDMERDALHQEVWRSQGQLNTRIQRDALGRRTGAWSRSTALEHALLAQDAHWPDAQQLLQTAQPLERKELQGLLKTWQYDKAGEMRVSQHSLHGARGYQYDATGRVERSQRLRLAGNTSSLAQAANEHFSYDPAGNVLDMAARTAAAPAAAQARRGYIQDNLVRVLEDKRFAYDGHDRLIEKRIGKHTIQRFEWDEENRLKSVRTTRRPGTEHAHTQSTHFRYDALGRRILKQDAFGTTTFIWEGMRLIEERRGSQITSYVYEPDSYVPLARLDTLGGHSEQGGLGTTADARATPTQPWQPPYHTKAANDSEAQYWASLDAPQPTAAHAAHTSPTAQTAQQIAHSEPLPLCKVFYFHTDQVGMPEELSNAQGQLVWQASYKTWGATVAEEWTVQTLAGQRPVEEGDKPHSEQNLRFQGQYLDRDTGLHYNTFRFYDPDMGRFICPDPIGLDGGLNLGSYAPNPISWIDPWGWSCRLENVGKTPGKKSKTGRDVIDRMRGEGRIKGEGDDMQFKSSDGKWYSIKDADMAHKTDAVKYWNKVGGFFGKKSKEVRAWMRDSKNYELEYYKHNRSKGGKLKDKYKDPGEFIGPAEKPKY